MPTCWNATSLHAYGVIPAERLYHLRFFILTSSCQTSVLEKVGSCRMVKWYHHFNDREPESFFILEFVRLEVELIFKFPFLICGGAYHLQFLIESRQLPRKLIFLSPFYRWLTEFWKETEAWRANKRLRHNWNVALFNIYTKLISCSIEINWIPMWFFKKKEYLIG